MPVTLALLAALILAGCGKPPAAAITVSSAAIGADGRIAARNTAFGEGLSMPVNWTAVPGAKTYALVLEDPDAPGAKPFVHWLVWNIPATVTRLAEGAAPPAGAVEGRNDMGASGYFGPRPPSGAHHYHLRVFALDRTLALAAGSDRDALAGAMRGRVIASGEVVGLASPPAR